MDLSKQASLNKGEKMEIAIFTSRSRKITKHLNFCIGGQKIVPVDSVKYLGLTLQSDPCWKTHLTSLEKTKHYKLIYFINIDIQIKNK